MVAAGLQYTGNGNTVGTIQQIQYAEHRICNGGHNVSGRVNVSNSTLMLTDLCLLTMETSIREEEGENLRNTNTNTSGTQIQYVKQHAVKTSSR